MKANRDIGVGYIAVLCGAALLYVFSCAPGSLWQDSGMFHYRIWHNDIEGGFGLALSHPLYHITGIAVKYLPFGEFGYRVNLISAVCGAIAVANVFLLLRLWLGRSVCAVIGAITLAVSWTFWQHSSIAEVYTLYAAIFTLELVLLLQYFRHGRVGYLYLLGFFNGLSIANHMWGCIPLLCYFILAVVLVKERRISFANIGIIVVLWIAGAGLYEYMIVKAMVSSGDIAGTVSSAFFGDMFGGSVLNTSLSARIVKENFLFLGYSFPTLNVVLFVVGLFGLYKLSPCRRFGHAMVGLTVLFFVFAFRYTVPDRYAFFIPFYCLASVFFGVGAYVVIEKYRSKAVIVGVFVFAFLPVAVYAVFPEVAEGRGVRIPTKRKIAYRNDYTYFLRPWQCGNDGPELFAGAALEEAGDDGVIIADGTTVYALWYLQEVKGKKKDVKVISMHGDYKNPIPFRTVDDIKELLADGRVYVVSPVRGYCPDVLLENYDFAKVGVLYNVIERQ